MTIMLAAPSAVSTVTICKIYISKFCLLAYPGYLTDHCAALDAVCRRDAGISESSCVCNEITAPQTHRSCKSHHHVRYTYIYYSGMHFLTRFVIFVNDNLLPEAIAECRKQQREGIKQKEEESANVYILRCTKLLKHSCIIYQ